MLEVAGRCRGAKVEELSGPAEPGALVATPVARRYHARDGALVTRDLPGTCVLQDVSTSGSSLHCPFDFHGLRSDEIGLGPFSGSSFDLSVRDGEIVRASMDWGIEQFSPQMWDPFATWVSEAYPEDAAIMYIDAAQTGPRLTEESIQLWEQHSREYVEEVGRRTVAETSST